MKQKTVVTYGTFDLFHIGHVLILERARSFGDRLIVGLSTDDFNTTKGKKAVFPYEDREQILRSCRFVDDVFPERSWEQKPYDLRKYKADTFVMGGDWEGKFDELREICEVIYLPRTPDISTTEVRLSIKGVQP